MIDWAAPLPISPRISSPAWLLCRLLLDEFPRAPASRMTRAALLGDFVNY